MMEAQAQLMQVVTQTIAQLNNNLQNNNNNPPPPPPPPPPQQDRLTRFLRLNPPTFSSSPEPIVADDWLRTINKKLDTIQAHGEEKVRFAAHQLEGPAAEWWDNYQITYPDIAAITWDQFQTAFRTAHVASEIIALKRREFRDLRQGSRSLSDYAELFNKLARYAPEDVNTDRKRQEEFMRGSMMRYPFSFVLLGTPITRSCMTAQWQLSPSTTVWRTGRESTAMTSMDQDQLTR
jgi:hypothetical protein